MIVALASALSMVFTGHEFGVSNNVFHIPLVLSWSELPQFQSNEFYSTLQYFTSAVWFIVRWLVTEQNIESVFLFLHLFSRAAAILGLIYLAWVLGLHNRLGLLLVSSGSVLSTHLLSTYVGGHDLFNNYFSHTPLSWPLLLLALADWHQGLFRRSMLWAGLVFLINAFVGVWLATALGISLLANFKDYPLRKWWQLAAIFLGICSPLIMWIKFALDSGATAAPFDYGDYIAAYYGGHFFFDTSSPARLLEGFALFAASIWMCGELGARRLAWVIAGLAMITIGGALLPMVINHRIVFNLHLLRAAGIAHFIFPLLALLVFWQRWQSNTWISRASGILIAVSAINGLSCLGMLIGLMLTRSWVLRSPILWAVILVSLAALLGPLMDAAAQLGRGQLVGLYLAASILMLQQDVGGKKQYPANLIIAFTLLAASVISVLVLNVGLSKFRLVGALVVAWGLLYQCWQWQWRGVHTGGYAWRILATILAVQLAGIAVVVTKRIANEKQERAEFADYFALIEWLKGQEPRGPLLAPLELIDQKQTDKAMFRYNLQLFGRQPVWVDWKQGAAVMWQPAFHAVWRPRFEAVKRLHSPTEFFGYAKENNIRWIMLIDATGETRTCPESESRPAFLQGRYRVCLLN